VYLTSDIGLKTSDIFAMLKNYLKIALRNLLRHKSYSFINIAGLAVGITCCLLILLFVQDELSYDRYHEKAERIYRLIVENQAEGRIFNNALSSAPMVPALLRDYPEIESAVRFYPVDASVLVSHEDKRFYEERFFYIFSAIALFILVIACINFMNLATARSEMRAREVGMRKVLGSQQRQLVLQFIGESVLMALIATLIAAVLIELLLPSFNAIASRELAIDYRNNWPFVVGLLALTLFVGVLAGSYPAFFLSAIKPVEVFKSRTATGLRSFFSRKVLVVFQFGISIILMIGTFVVYSQLDYMRNKKLGYDQEQVVVVPIKDAGLLEQRQTFKQTLLQNPAVSRVTFTSRYPGIGTFGTVARRPDRADVQVTDMKVLLTDFDFIETLDIALAAGRSFSQEMDADTTRDLLLNETAARALGWSAPEEAVGKTINALGNRSGTIVGAVKDFHFQSLQMGMQPLLLTPAPDRYAYAMLRIAAHDIGGTLKQIESAWAAFAPQWPFDYLFLDQNFDKLYRAEQRLGKIFGAFGGIAIFIACLGLFGLASFTAGRRTREIGIRKVLGASVAGIVQLLSREFVKLVLVANVIAWPVAYFVMNKWLQDFAYRIAIGWWVFALAGGIALLIALLTVSTQAIKAALANPVEALRYE
jgi:putative ABC transport system permease protein